jgi:GT2 family glycosyltransferase
MKSVELLILNYNGRRHLELMLPSAVAESGKYGSACTVTVIDNRSTEPDVAWVRNAFPSVRVWIAPRNEFLFSYNEYARHSDAEILILLNNDLILRPRFIEALIKHFDEPDVFSVGATSLDWEGKEFTCGPAILIHENGSYRWPYDVSRQEACHTFFTSGGFMAVDRAKFLTLEGFDRLYYPAYCEDVDLCFRAWRKGWRCIFEPASVVLHREGGSWQSAGKKKVDRILLKNTLLLQWISLPMRQDMLKRWFSNLKVIIGTTVVGDFGWLQTLVRAWFQYVCLESERKYNRVSPAELRVIRERISEAIP